MKKFFQSYKQVLMYVLTFLFISVFFSLFAFNVLAEAGVPGRGPISPVPSDLKVSETALGFTIPTLGALLTFAIRGFFVIAGLAALFYMLLGAFAWVTSGGDKDAVSAAQQKIQAAVVGVLVIVGVLAIIWTLEKVIFKEAICFGLSCPVTLPQLIKKS